MACGYKFFVSVVRQFDENWKAPAVIASTMSDPK